MYHVKRAVIMAAGIGKRMRPVTLEVPKPLIKVNGTRMIDTVIRGLRANGISEIYIVVGYLKEKFRCLEKEYEGVRLIENPYYDTCNNISSLYVARKYLEDVMILDGDQIIYNQQILCPDFERSGYNAVWTDQETKEWLLDVEDEKIIGCSRSGGSGGWQLFSISRWSSADGHRLMKHLETEFEQHKNRQIYWDDVAMFCYPQEYELGIRPMQPGDVLEIDNLEELAALDKTYEMRERKMNDRKRLEEQIDWFSTIVPLAGVMALCAVFMAMPEQSAVILQAVRGFLGDDCGIYYALLGTGIFGCTMYMAFSRFGRIRLGNAKKPQYPAFQWGTMIFTSTMAADILFYSLCEWALYANERHIEEMGGIQRWASTYPLFHWGPIAWSFYIVLAVAFGFMLHVRGREKQKFSEACRPLLGKRVDGIWGRIIDLIAIFALIAGTATTFSLATPLLSAAVSQVFGLSDSTGLTIVILLLIAAVYTLTVWFGMRGISKLASYCAYLFFVLLLYVLLAGNETVYILETGFSALGNLVQNFVGMSTWMDPLRENSFPQNWTIYYWAYWMVWCVATPFFIGTISRGRTIKNTVLGGYSWGLAGTFTSFIILGNYGMAQQMKHGLDISGFIGEGGSYSEAILKIFDTLPLSSLGLILLVVTMIAFYSTTFDSITMVVSSYSYKKLSVESEPDKRVRTFWAVMFILFPIALIFAENSMYSLQSVSIIAAFPIGFIILLITASFFKDAGAYLKEK